jgi:DMSO/TMAO reductase YedYZ molybdopterin-dependent catalytic subunit
MLAATVVVAQDHGPPQASPMSDAITVGGAVEHPLTLRVADLEQFPPQQLGEVAMICDSGVNLSKEQNLKGVLLRDILNKAQLKAANPRDLRKMVVIANATDHYKAVFSWAEIFNSATGDKVIVYVSKDGQPLGPGEGHIALISPTDQRTGPRHVKWLNGIEVRQIVE